MIRENFVLEFSEQNSRRTERKKENDRTGMYLGFSGTQEV